MKYVLIAICCVVLAGTAFGQEWSSEQMEVWNAIKADWKVMAVDKNVDAHLANMHEDFLGWGASNPMPRTKEAVGRWSRSNLEMDKTVEYDVSPVAIKVHGDVAFAYYYYVERSKNASGKYTTTTGRYMDLLKKMDGTWKFIGWFGKTDSSN